MQISRTHDGPRVRRAGASRRWSPVQSSCRAASSPRPPCRRRRRTARPCRGWTRRSPRRSGRTRCSTRAPSTRSTAGWSSSRRTTRSARRGTEASSIPCRSPARRPSSTRTVPTACTRRAGTTAWPGPIAVASTWNLELGEEKAVAHGSESFDSRSAVVLGPGIASGRTPLSGRGSEYFGEDPLLSGLMAAANVRGLEHGNPDKPVVANLKHYVANEQELDRQTSSSNVDERTFRQVYDLPYEIAVKESDPGSVMCSYNQVNGVYACENPHPHDEPRPADGLRRLRHERLRFGALDRGVARRRPRPGAQPSDLVHAGAARRCARRR